MEELGAWEEIDETEVPYTSEGIQHSVIESMWAFKAKCFPDESVKKYKVHMCVCGDQQFIDDIIDQMRDQGFGLHVKDDAAGFLGIDFLHLDDGSIELKQSALIEQIIEAVGFQHASSRPTPAE
eukprot:2941317-Ditylum_brightwellii.AAC.1